MYCSIGYYEKEFEPITLIFAFFIALLITFFIFKKLTPFSHFNMSE